MSRATEDFARSLAHDLRPLRPLPRLRVVFLGLVVLWGVGILQFGLFAGSATRLWAAVAWHDPLFAAVLVGLVLAAGGAITCALARAIPGREVTARLGGGIAFLGLLLAIGTAAWGAIGSGASLPLSASFICVGRACGVALLPLIAALAFLAWATTPRPSATVALAVAGAVAAGATLIHAGCPAGEAFHILVGHALAPLLVAAAITLPLSPLLRQADRWLQPQAR